jgi:hypothetical protein
LPTIQLLRHAHHAGASAHRPQATRPAEVKENETELRQLRLPARPHAVLSQHYLLAGPPKA